MSNTCSRCGCGHIYQDGELWVCLECAYKWSEREVTSILLGDAAVYDANGNRLNEGDSVTIIKDLKVEGSSPVIKGGTKIKGIRLVDGYDGHNRSCGIPELEIGIRPQGLVVAVSVGEA